MNPAYVPFGSPFDICQPVNSNWTGVDVTGRKFISYSAGDLLNWKADAQCARGFLTFSSFQLSSVKEISLARFPACFYCRTFKCLTTDHFGNTCVHTVCILSDCSGTHLLLYGALPFTKMKPLASVLCTQINVPAWLGLEASSYTMILKTSWLQDSRARFSKLIDSKSICLVWRATWNSEACMVKSPWSHPPSGVNMAMAATLWPHQVGFVGRQLKET